MFVDRMKATIKHMKILSGKTLGVIQTNCARCSSLSYKRPIMFRKKSCRITIGGLNMDIGTPKLQDSLAVVRHYSVPTIQPYELLPQTNIVYHDKADIKLEAIDIFQAAITAVSPRSMIEDNLHFDKASSTLRAQEKTYHLQKNVFIVGFGKSVIGMARFVEDMIGDHVVMGIICVPYGLQRELKDANHSELLMSPDTKICVVEGSPEGRVDYPSHAAAKAIDNLVSRLTENDLLIVLTSGGGSKLCPSPQPPITLEDLFEVTRLLKHNGASLKDRNTVRKNIEILKGGGLAMKARPAKVLSLILSSVVGDHADLIASGPTYPAQRHPHQCIEILKRLKIFNKIPTSVRTYLQKECKNRDMFETQSAANVMRPKPKHDDDKLRFIKNMIVGNNSMACEAAACRALELGYLPLVITKELKEEARYVGCVYVKLAKFIMMCFDRKLATEPNKEAAILETQLVASGISKAWVNRIAKTVEKAHQTNKDICVIAGGETVSSLRGSEVGGKNLDTALAATLQMREEFQSHKMPVAESNMCFLSCDSVGHDGMTKLAGAVVDQDFLDRADQSGLDMKRCLQNNEALKVFSHVNGGRNLIQTNLTGTDVMDFVVVLIQKPREKRYVWKEHNHV